MPKHVFKIEDGRFGLTVTDPEVTDACTATIADFDAYTCQITNGALTASPNVTQETVPATWCDPEEIDPAGRRHLVQLGDLLPAGPRPRRRPVPVPVRA